MTARRRSVGFRVGLVALWMLAVWPGIAAWVMEGSTVESQAAYPVLRRYAPWIAMRHDMLWLTAAQVGLSIVGGLILLVRRRASSLWIAAALLWASAIGCQVAQLRAIARGLGERFDPVAAMTDLTWPIGVTLVATALLISARRRYAPPSVHRAYWDD